MQTSASTHLHTYVNTQDSTATNAHTHINTHTHTYTHTHTTHTPHTHTHSHTPSCTQSGARLLRWRAPDLACSLWRRRQTGQSLDLKGSPAMCGQPGWKCTHGVLRFVLERQEFWFGTLGLELCQKFWQSSYLKEFGEAWQVVYECTRPLRKGVYLPGG